MRVALVQQNFYLSRQNVNNNKSKNVSFESIANAGKLKILFSYGLPCMYSGVEMIDPKKAQKLLKNGTFKRPVSEVIPAMKPFEHLITGIESSIYRIIKREGEKHPDYTLQDILKKLTPAFRKQLRKKQAPVFEEIDRLAVNLPENTRYKYSRLMDETNRKLLGLPIIVPFSSTEFRYKLEKAKEDFTKRKEYKNIRLINKMLKESERFYKETTFATLDHQKKVLNYLNLLYLRSGLKNNEPMKNLMETSLGRVNEERVVVPFSRKSFIYDLTNIVKTIPDTNLREEMTALAQTLPTSKESVPAYIIKFASEPSEKIGYRLMWPNFASVEHIKPKSCGGPDSMENFGGATTKENADRQNIPFINQLKRKPQTPIFCQKYVDRLIELVKNGIFARNYIDTKYIDDFKRTIKRESQGRIILDTTKLNEIESL